MMVRRNQYSFSLISGEMGTRKTIREVGTYPPGTEHVEPSLLRLWFIFPDCRTNDWEFLHKGSPCIGIYLVSQ